jgi:anthranilate synthase component 1
MLYPDFNEFKRLSRSGNLIPIYKELVADMETPVSTFLKLAAGEPYAYLLESVEGGERWGRYSFISWAPKQVFQSKGHKYSINKPGHKPGWKFTNDPILELRKLMKTFKPREVKGLPIFWGGAVGY